MLAAPCGAQQTLDGGTGLLNVPSADVLDEGAGAFQYSRIHPDLARELRTESWYAAMGFAPGLELGGRVIATALRAGRRDLSLDAKYRLPFAIGGVRFALGAQDLGGAERLLPREYAAATWSNDTLAVTAGYGHARNVLDGPFGGIEWRPWPFIAAIVEHDAEDVNAGLRLAAPLWAGWRLGTTAAWRGALRDEEYAIHLEFPLGGNGTRRRAPRERPALWERPMAATVAGMARSHSEETSHSDETSQSEETSPSALRARLIDLGFEAVRTGRRAPATLVVQLENRRYNHAAADGIGLALGVARQMASPETQRIELYLLVYGVPQLMVIAPAVGESAVGAASAATNGAPTLHAEFIDAIPEAPAIAWDAPAARATAWELVLEPLLRTTVGTEFGLLDYGLGARARLTAPLARGVLAHVGVPAPLARSDDFAPGEVFEDLAIRGGVDLALLQYLHTPAPGWSLLWSGGRTRVFRADALTAALDQAWSPGDGRHRFRMKLMHLELEEASRDVALAGYNWLDARRAYGIGLTAGRFYAGDAGARLDVERHFGDTIVGLFWKFASPDDQAAGVAVSLPLTPRRDARPHILQIKGARRWAHSLGTTLNAPPSATSPNGTNPIRPLLLHEPVLELDLERDIHDAGRLSPEYLRQNDERMREAYERWG